MDSTFLLGVRLDSLSEKETIWQCQNFLESSGTQGQLIATVNSEFMVTAQTDNRFKTILNSAALCLVDTMGVVLMAKLFLKKTLTRLPGADFFWPLLALANQQQSRVYFLGGRSSSAAKTTQAVKQKYPNLIIVGFNEGPRFKIANSQLIFEPGQDQINAQVLQEINQLKPTIIFTAFGAPKQEYWLNEFLSQCPSIKIGIGVGGTFDFVSGLAIRAPLLFRRFGLEWLWRLAIEPWRYKRIFNALIKFPFLCFNYYIIKNN